MHTISLLTIGCLALALPLVGQDEGPARTQAGGPMLVVKTNHSDVAEGMLASFGSMADVPSIGDRKHYVIEVGADRAAKLTVADGPAALFEAVADPGKLMTAFAEEIDAVKGMMQAGVMLALQQSGYSAKEAVAFFDQMLAFPRQIGQLAIVVAGDPEDPAQGFDVTMDGTPVAGGYLATFIGQLEAGKKGVPVLPTEGALFDMALSLSPAAMTAALAPFRGLVESMLPGGKDQREQAARMLDAWMQAYDGNVAIAFGANMQGSMLVGLVDPARVAAMLASDDYLALMQGRNEDAEIETKITRDALQHRGAKWMRSDVTGAEPNPMMPEGSVTSFAGIVGEYMAMTFGGDEKAARSLIDRVLDGKLRRQPLEGGTLLQVGMDLHAILGLAMEQAGGDLDLDDVPSRIALTLARRGTGLRVAMKMK